MTCDQDDFLRCYFESLQEDNAAAFIGAGLSKAAGYSDWATLLSPIAKQLNLDIEKEANLVALAQYYVNSKGGDRTQLNELLSESFDAGKNPTKDHSLLAKLPIKTYWTTNYDRLIEESLCEIKKDYEVIHKNDHLINTKSNRQAFVYKMHGDVMDLPNTIITKDDYEHYTENFKPFITALSNDLSTKTFLFLGLSFNDQNLDYILSRLRVIFKKQTRQHYCITRRFQQSGNHTYEDVAYFRRKQDFIADDLKRLGVHTIFVDNFSEITGFLERLYRRHLNKTVFISGSADCYGDWGRDETHSFVFRLAQRLIDLDFRLASGFGRGIGSALIHGAVEKIYSTPGRRIEQQLLMRPFPFSADETTSMTYRRELVEKSGVSIFLLGNKREGAEIKIAEGVEKEFKIACHNNNRVIPIGASGFMAKNLWERVMNSFESYFPGNCIEVHSLMKQLGASETAPKDLIEPLLQLVQIISRE